jgi:DNA polymerase III subunit epsilon
MGRRNSECPVITNTPLCLMLMTDQVFIELSTQKRNNPQGLYLFIDTETTGLPKRLVANGETDDAFEEEKHLLLWPRLVRLSYIIQDGRGTEILANDFIIKPDHFIIPTVASDIHGITTEIANTKGQPLKTVLRHFRQVYDYTRFIVGHNIYFDTKVIAAEFLRNDIQDTFTNRSKLDTMGLSVDYCAIKGHYSYKYPTLSELYQKLFNKSFEGAHSSAIDVRIVATCFGELRGQNIIEQDNYGMWRAKTP